MSRSAPPRPDCRPTSVTLPVEVARSDAARWRAENREALASSNEYVERHGLKLAEFRQF